MNRDESAKRHSWALMLMRIDLGCEGSWSLTEERSSRHHKVKIMMI